MCLQARAGITPLKGECKPPAQLVVLIYPRKFPELYAKSTAQTSLSREKPLHYAIVVAINEFCDVKVDVAEALRESVCEVLETNLNGSVQAAQRRIDELAKNIDELIKLATVPENAEGAVSDTKKFSEEMKNLR